MKSTKKQFQSSGKQLQTLRSAAASDPFGFIQDNFLIPNEDGDLVPFLMRHDQQRFAAEVMETVRKGEPVRRFDLKSRRVGFSSIVSAFLQANVWARDNYYAAIIAHEKPRASEILQRCRNYHRHMDVRLQIPFNKDRQDALEYALTNSSLMVGSAENPRRVRGQGLMGAQLTEASYFGPRFSLVMKEIGPVIPYRPGTAVFIETTGHLRGSQAHDFWLDCKKGKRNFTARFWGWLDDPSCHLPFIDERQKNDIFERIQQLCPRLYEKNRYFKLTAEQIHYSYHTWLNNCDADYDYFCTEYPYSEQEAWTLPGSSYFGDTNLAVLKPDVDFTTYVWGTRLISAPFNTFADDLTIVDRLDDSSPLSYIRVWEPARTGRRYCIGTDVSTGEEGSDYSAMYVIDMVSRDCMAAFHGRVRPDEHAIIAYSLSKLYNRALVAPEINFGGMGVIDHLVRLGVPLYKWKRPDDGGGMKDGRKAGWLTNVWSRDYMLAELRKMVAECCRLGADGNGIFRDPGLLSEMETFAVNPSTGKAEAMSRHWDDRVIAMAIAQIVASQEVRKALVPTVTDGLQSTLSFPSKNDIKPSSPLWSVRHLMGSVSPQGMQIRDNKLIIPAPRTWSLFNKR